MQTNSIENYNFSKSKPNNVHFQRNSQRETNASFLLRTIIVDGMWGVGINAVWSSLSPISRDAFLKKGQEIIDESPADKVKARMNNRLMDLFELKANKTLEESLKNDEPAIKFVKEVVRKAKIEQAFRSGRIGGLICAGLGLVVGLASIALRRRHNQG